MAVHRGDGFLLLRLGPQEGWLCCTLERRAALERLIRPVIAQLQAQAVAVSVIDLGDAWPALELSGPDSFDWLAQGCALDVRALGMHRCARTRLAQAPVVVVPWPELAGVTLRVERSYLGYVERWFEQARGGSSQMACSASPAAST
jgi:sarcosine oxidase gamma subunit